MTAKLIAPTQTIDVHQICCLIFGQPGSRKSSLAQTAANPITLATDPGIYRAYGRKLAVQVETWADVLDACQMPECEQAGTIVTDTLGMLLDKLSLAIISDNAKHGNRMGGLSLQGYGVLKNQFSQWVNQIKAKGKDLVFICHEKAEKSGDDVYYCPDIVGGSYNTLMNVADCVGYLHFEGGKRVLDFSPTDRWMAKVPPCSWGQLVLPDFAAEPDYLGKLLAEAKASMGRISAESALIAQTIDQWHSWLEGVEDIDTFNKGLADLASLSAVAKRQAWHLMTTFADAKGWSFDKKAKTFVATEAA